MSSADETDSYEEDPSYTSEMPSNEVETRHNKVQELINDNKELRSIMRITALEMEQKHHKLSEFYDKLKTSAQQMSQLLSNTRATVTEQTKTITFLKTEKTRLQLELATSGTGNMQLNDPKKMDISKELKNQYEDTLESLIQQLQQAEEDKRSEAEKNQLEVHKFRIAWNDREKEWNIHLTRCIESFEEEKQVQIEEMHRKMIAIQHERQRDFEEETSSLKKQVMALIGEHQQDSKQLESQNTMMGNIRSSFQAMETKNFQMSKDIENLKLEKKRQEDEMSRMTHDLEQMTFLKNEKEKSLDELFEVYDKEREERQRLELELDRMRRDEHSMELDKIYAQYLCAEESIKKKNEEISKLSKKIETDKTEYNTQISIYKQQADIFKKDFEMEREARQKQHSESENLKTMVGQYQIEMQRMKQEIMRLQARPFQPRPPYQP